MSDLLPCPFCGADAEPYFNDFYGDMSMARCKSCGASAYNRNWNTRAPSAPSAGVDEVARDAARYRWLRDSAGDTFDGPYIAGQKGAPMAGAGWVTGSDADAVVDAAIQSAAQGEVS